MIERLKMVVLKTTVPARAPGVQIPLLPLLPGCRLAAMSRVCKTLASGFDGSSPSTPMSCGD